MRRTRIAGIGHYVPERVVTNQELEGVMDTTDEWIRERSGIQERHFAAPGQGSADLGVRAAQVALDGAGWKARDVQFIIFATLSPDMFFPGNGCLLQDRMGMGTIGALDVRNQCSGFVYGLSIADAWIRTGTYDRILLVGAEVQSAGLQMDSAGRDTAVLFGDGAGAVCLEVTEGRDGSCLLEHRLHSEGKYADELSMRAPSSVHRPWISHAMIDEGLCAPHMNGREVFRHAVTRFPEVIEEVLAAGGATIDQLTMVVPHQANLRIIEAMRKRLGLPEEKVYANIQRYGNTTAASIPIAFSEAVAEGRIRRGDLVCLAAFGSGFTWGATLLRF